MWEEASEVGGGSLRLDISFFFFFFFKVDMLGVGRWCLKKLEQWDYFRTGVSYSR